MYEFQKNFEHVTLCTTFHSVLSPFQDYFISYESIQSESGTKTGEPQDKTSGTPASRTWPVSHVSRAALEPTRHSGEMIEWLQAR